MIADWASFPHKIASLLGSIARPTNLLPLLGYNGEALADLNDEFQAISRNYIIKTFYETGYQIGNKKVSDWDKFEALAVIEL
jgi:hypothetical protein